jgi:hypothetical protein
LADGADAACGDIDVVVGVVFAVGVGLAQDTGRATSPTSRTIRAPCMMIDLARRCWRQPDAKLYVTPPPGARGGMSGPGHRVRTVRVGVKMATIAKYGTLGVTEEA